MFKLTISFLCVFNYQVNNANWLRKALDQLEIFQLTHFILNEALSKRDTHKL